jgi:hypothetical protein
MTTERYGRCVTCGIEYHYYMSGMPSHDSHTDSSYCPECKKVAQEALLTVRPKFECRYTAVSELEQYKDVTLDMLLEHEEEVHKKAKEERRLLATRIWPAMYNLKTGDTQSIREIRYKGVPYRVSVWSKSDECSIEVPMEYDLINERLTGNLWRG